MPFYEYICPDKHEHQRFYPHCSPAKRPTCPTCKKKSRRNYRKEAKYTDCVDRPRWSDAMGVHPDQIPEAMRRFPGSQYNSEGQLLVESRADKKKKMKERGYVELD